MLRTSSSSLRVRRVRVDAGEPSHFHRCVQALDGKVVVIDRVLAYMLS